MKIRKIIQLELNELSKDILDSFVSSGRSKGFREVFASWQHVRTESETEYRLFEPWIQWVTAHTGKSFAEHGVFHLGDVDLLKQDQIWEVLSDKNIESAIIGCMNAKRGRARGGIFLPDPWAKDPEVYPAKLMPLWKFISSRVQKHATEKGSFRDLIGGAFSSLNHSIPMSLYLSIARQLVNQKLDPSTKWKLAALFDEFLFAIFENVLDETDFRFNAVFMNAMAHYQHHYWREFQPDHFANDIRSPDCGPGDNPILYGVEIYDRLVEKILPLSRNPENLVIIATGLSQVPFLADEKVGGMHYYRLNDHQSFAGALNLLDSQSSVSPLMSRDWQMNFSDEAKLTAAHESLRDLQVGGKALFKVEKNTPSSLFIETAVTSPQYMSMEIVSAKGHSLGLFRDWFSSTAVKSGCHSGIGHVWCSQPVFEKQQKVPLTELFYKVDSLLN